MKSIGYTHKRSAVLVIAGIVVFSGAVLLAGIPRAKAQTTKGTGFATAQAAVDALIDAAQKYDDQALASILGPNSYDIIHTGEPVRDKEMAIEFATQARTKQSLTNDPRRPGHMILNVGSDDWPFPIPIVKLAGNWYFDTNTGREEIPYGG